MFRLKGSNEEMKKNWKRIMTAACAALLAFRLPVYAATTEEEPVTAPVQVELKHVHTGNDTKEGGCYTAVYHHHDGSTEKGGSCYKDSHTVDYGTSLREEKGFCSGTVTQWWFSDDDSLWHTYTTCGHNCSANLCGMYEGTVGQQCQYEIVTGYHYVCNKCGQQSCNGVHTEYSLTCNKIVGVTLDGYAPSCGMTEKTVIGIYSIVPSMEAGIVNGMELKADVAGSVSVIKYQWNNGEVTDSITVKGNGSYTCQVTYKDGEKEYTQPLTIQVKNIDNLPPKVAVETINGTEEITVKVNASDIPASAESASSGLADEAYSWDGGNTWTSENTKTVTEAGNCEIWVRDKAGNVTKGVFYIKTDYTAPVVSLSAASGWTRGNVEIVADARDGIPEGAEPDVSGGDAAGSIGISGLAPQAYSWDGGNTWTDSNRISASDNGSYSVIVRDNEGNTAHAEITVSCIDRSAPVITSVERQYEEWLQEAESMEITVHASDAQSGLAATAYSFDGGNTWTNNNCYIVTEEGSIIVAVRDMLGNTAWQTLEFVRAEEPVPEPEPERPAARKTAAKERPAPEEPEEEPEEELEEMSEVTQAPIPAPTKEPEPEPDPEEEKEMIEIPDITTPTSPNLMVTVAAAGTGTATSGFAVFIVFWIFRKCLLLDSEDRKLGKAYIWKRKGKYFVKISTAAAKKADGQLTVKFKKNFVRANKEKPIDIKVNQHVFERNIAEKIHINFK